MNFPPHSLHSSDVPVLRAVLKSSLQIQQFQSAQVFQYGLEEMSKHHCDTGGNSSSTQGIKFQWQMCLGYLHLILTLDSPLPHCTEPLSSPLHSAIFLFQSRSHKCAAIAQLKLFQLLWHPHDMNQNRLALLLTCQLQKRQSITHQAAGDLKEN